MKKNKNNPTPSVDLTNCDREPIHIPGLIQPFGCLIALSADFLISRISENAGEMLGVNTDEILGEPLGKLLKADTLHAIRERVQFLGDNELVERIFDAPVGPDGARFDIAVHCSGSSLILEFEPSPYRPSGDYTAIVRNLIQNLSATDPLEETVKLAARQIKSLTGFDRVMVYRFHPDLSGDVIAEAKENAQEPFLGLRYPASDIPAQARTLYTKNLLRLIADVNAEPVPVTPTLNTRGEPLDMSLSTLRAVSPIHIEYLQNMGVASSMSISILKRGKLWGLFACHHREPFVVPFARRTAAELYAQLFSFLLDQKEADAERQHTAMSRKLHDNLMMRLAGGDTIDSQFAQIKTAFDKLIDFDGIVLAAGGRFQSAGLAPSEDQFSVLSRLLNTNDANTIFSTDELGAIWPPARDLSIAGALALPVSRSPRDYIVLFRRPISQVVFWAGNPQKSAEAHEDSVRLSPRKSFASWRQVVEGKSAPWTEAELSSAESLRVTLLEIVLRMADAAVDELSKAQERQELLIAELNHRVRNILNLIRGLVGQSAAGAGSATELTEILGGRIHALARAHDQITRQQWNAASFHDLVNTEAEAYLFAKHDRVRLSAPDVMLEPQAFATLSLVIHELMTNSAKHGALSDNAGAVTVETGRTPEGGVAIAWRESGGPPVQPPTRRGFGSTIIERSIPFELKGTAEIKFHVSGLRAEFTIPSKYIATNATPRESVRASPETSNEAFVSGEVLLLEDNVIIALEAESILLSMGAVAVHMASSVTQAQAIIDKVELSFAMLDINLGGETSMQIAERLHDLGVPFCFSTGYGELAEISKDFPGTPVMQKPYSPDDVKKAVAAAKPATN